MDEKKNLAAEYGFDIDSLDFSVEDLTLDELRAKFEEMKAASPSGLGGSEDDKNFALESVFRDELRCSLSQEKAETPWGPDDHYWFWDYDKELMEVYATDAIDWNLYGFTYSMDGDHVVIDFGSKKRMKIAVEPFDEGSTASPFMDVFSKILEKSIAAKETALQSQFDTERADLEAKYQNAESAIAQMNAELDDLRQFKQQKLGDERAAEEDAVFEQFQDLNGLDAFEKLRENCSELSIEEIEDKCFAIRGRNTSTQTFSSQKPKATRLPVEKTGKADEPYGGLFQEFPPHR